MVKYKEYYTQMLEKNTQLFAAFRPIHDAFAKDRKSDKKEFDRVGKQVMEVVEEWERRLCQTMEKGNNSVYSARLADKFLELVKQDFPMIELVGVQISYR